MVNPKRHHSTSIVERLEDRRLLAAALPSDNALAFDGTYAFGDLNGDGKLDMVQVVTGTDYRTGITGWGVDLYFNRASGQAPATTVPRELRQSQHVNAIPGARINGNACAVIGDINGDRKNDIVVYVIPNAGNQRLPHGGVLLGDGKGGFKSGGTFDLQGFVSFDGNWGLTLADFNGDKRPDLMAYTYTAAPPYNIASRVVTLSSTIGIALNNGAGKFRDMVSMNNPLVPALPLPPLPAGAEPQGKYSYFRVLGAGDLDGNGRAEIVCQIDTDTIAMSSPTTFSPLAFSAAKTITLPGAQAATAATATTTSSSLSPLGNVLQPPGSTQPSIPVFGSLPQTTGLNVARPAAKPAFAFLTDVNRDGFTDIAVLRGSAAYIGVNRSLQTSASKRPAFGWRQFSVPVPLNPLGPAGNTTMTMFVADLDGKGKQTMCFLVAGSLDLYALLGTQSLPAA